MFQLLDCITPLFMARYREPDMVTIMGMENCQNAVELQSFIILCSNSERVSKQKKIDYSNVQVFILKWTI